MTAKLQLVFMDIHRGSATQTKHLQMWPLRNVFSLSLLFMHLPHNSADRKDYN